MEEKGEKLAGVRIDSGDLAYFSRQVRKILDDAGLDYVKVVASNDVDEYIIAEIQRNKGAIDLWGIGTKLATCYDDPALGGVYKLVEINDEPKIKISSNVEKMTIPSKKQVYRVYNGEGFMSGDIMELREKEDLEEGYVYDPLNPMRFYNLKNPVRDEPLLHLRMDEGKIVTEMSDWKKARRCMEKDIELLPDASKRLLNPQNYRVSISQSIHDLRNHLIEIYIGKDK